MPLIALGHVGYHYMNSYLIHDQTLTGYLGSLMGCTQNHKGKKTRILFPSSEVGNGTTFRVLLAGSGKIIMDKIMAGQNHEEGSGRGSHSGKICDNGPAPLRLCCLHDQAFAGLCWGWGLLKLLAMAKKALITGITGQDGSYLAELLLGKGYEVHGIIRRASTFNTGRLDPIYQDPHSGRSRLFLHYGDLSDASGVARLIGKIQPEEVYNLAAQSHVRVSFDSPEYTSDITATGTVRLLEAIRETGIRPRFYQASSSEMFGMVREVPQTEKTPFYPRSPYGCAKVFSYWITVNYRESYGLHANNGILFNHESPRRGETFVTRKITRAVAHIKAGLEKKLFLDRKSVV